jgi:hypothetical protein
MVTMLDTLDRLDELSVTLAIANTDDGLRLVTSARPGIIDTDLRAAILEHRIMLINILIARATGHAPAPCTECGQITFTAIRSPGGKRRDGWPACRFTPGCEGRHEPRQRDIDRTKPRPPPARPRPPRRPSKQRHT